ILSAMCPEQDWRWIRRHPDKPGTGEIRATRKRRQPPDLPQLLTGCLDLMAEADSRRPSVDAAVQFRNALIGAVLSVLPLRRKNLAGLTLGRDILVDDASIDIAIPAVDTKNRRPICGALHGEVADGLRRYLELHRPLLLGDHVSDRLWINRNGDPLDYTGFRRVMESVGLATLGRPITTHMLRHAVATFTMTRDPRNGPITKDLLSHRTARTAQQYYDESGRAPAQREWERILQANRQKAMEELEWRER
ncbi:tyrosine-type recombinase/integrase, partial [Stella sp.]|uniref:tyrosine-type recombinase/integrase n=1 Tax=Stella sp. TaxID=2912054 RepID=UPI0035B442A6